MHPGRLVEGNDPTWYSPFAFGVDQERGFVYMVRIAWIVSNKYDKTSQRHGGQRRKGDDDLEGGWIGVALHISPSSLPLSPLSLSLFRRLMSRWSCKVRRVINVSKSAVDPVGC